MHAQHTSIYQRLQVEKEMLIVTILVQTCFCCRLMGELMFAHLTESVR